MEIKNTKLKEACQHYKKISLLSKTISLADWDMQTNMPPKGNRGRAEQVSYLTEILVNLWLDPHFSNLVSLLEHENLMGIEKATVRNLLQAGKLFFKVPKKLLIERARLTSEAVAVWQQARQNKDFKLFAPYLEKIVAIHQEIPHYLGGTQPPYDVLLDLFEPDLTSAKFDRIIDILKEPLIALHKTVYEKSKRVKFEEHSFDRTQQEKLSMFIMNLMGYDLQAGRLDESAHPFCTTFDRQDVRITTKYHLDDMRISLSSVMHEAGHALYEQGLPQKFEDTPIGQAASYGVHESQSRLWENQIGKSPLFIKFILSKLVNFFPDYFRSFDMDKAILYFNQLKETPIRIDADEIAYNLHIILRYEIERDLIAEKISVNDLPVIWSEKSQSIIGVTPPDVSTGVLQDIHWSYGSFGYFPTYTLGNIYAAQILHALTTKISLKEILPKGDLKPIKYWLDNNIYRFGSVYEPDELVKKATGKLPDATYLLEYLKNKYTEIYGL